MGNELITTPPPSDLSGLGLDVNYTPTQSTVIRDCIATGNSRQLINIHLKSSAEVQEYFILDNDSVDRVISLTRDLCHTLKLSLAHRSPFYSIFLQAWQHISNIYLRSFELTSRVKNSNGNPRKVIVGKFLGSCEKLICNFLERFDDAACKSSDVQEFQRGLEDRISFVISSLRYFSSIWSCFPTISILC